MWERTNSCPAEAAREESLQTCSGSAPQHGISQPLSTLLYSTLLYSTLLYSTLLYYTILCYAILYYTVAL